MKKRFPDKEFMPLAIEVKHKKIVLIGGGRIALQKVQVLSRYCHNIHVVATEIVPEILDSNASTTVKAYDKSDLDGAFLVYACTNIKELNRQVREDAHEKGILVNVVDDPAICDFVSPAVFRQGQVSVAVTTNAESAVKSVEIRNAIKKQLENDSILTI